MTAVAVIGAVAALYAFCVWVAVVDLAGRRDAQLRLAITVTIITATIAILAWQAHWLDGVVRIIESGVTR